MPRTRALGLAALLVGNSIFAQTPAGSPRPIDAADLVSRLRPAVRLENRPDTAFNILDRMRYYHVPGVSIAVVDNFRIVFAGGFGVTEFGGHKPVDTTTLFLAGSISKPVFATGRAQARRRGQALARRRHQPLAHVVASPGESLHR